jgi:uncharacterized membrane protein
MALALWVGGMVAIGVLVAPVAFSEAPSRAIAGRIVGRTLQRFDRLVLVCILALAVTSVLLVRWYGRWSAWYAIEYICIALMSASALFSMFVLAPRLRSLRQRRESAIAADRRAAAEEAQAAMEEVAEVKGEIAAATAGPISSDDKDEFDRLHRLSVLAMQFNLACGTMAILFS